MLTATDLEAMCRENDFSPRAIAKGLRYAEQGRVLNSNVTLHDGAMRINARVSGSDRQPYEVTVDVEPQGAEIFVEGKCTCPVAWNCKHVVAAIAAASGQAPRRAGDGSPLARIAPVEELEETPEPLSPALDYWLTSIREPPRLVAAPASQKRLVYVLTSHGGQTVCPHLALMHLYVKKNGEPGKASRVSIYGPPSQILEDPINGPDRDLLILLFGQYGCASDIALSDSAGGLLSKILATGRCYWEKAKGKPLALGAPRPAQAVWQELPDGSQQAVFEVQPPAGQFLGLAPPWYVDMGAGECGPLQVQGDPQAALRWLAAPKVAPEQTAALARSIGGLPVPAPRQVQVHTRRGIRPVPILKLARIALKKPIYSPRYGRDDEDNYLSALDAAWVEFEYNGVRISSQSRQEFITERKGDVLERIQRMPRVEEEFLEEVETSGLAPVSQVLWYQVPAAVKDAYTMADPKEWIPWVTETLPGAARNGWRVEVDPSFSYRRAEVESWYSETTGEGSGEDWFSYELGIVVEGQRINLLPILGKLLAQVLPGGAGEKIDIITWKFDDGRIVDLPAARLRNIAATLVELFDPDALSGGKLRLGRLRAAELVDLNDQTPWRGPDALRQLADRLQNFQRIQPVEPPPGLQATLRPYQLEGLSWLQFLREHEFAGILADDMGLGKTVQALAHVLLEKQAGRATAPTLVVAPTSLMANWRAEAAKFAPALKVLVLHGGGRKEHFDQIPEHDLIVTSYALLPRDREILQQHAFHMLILDEAQYIKNPRALWSETVRSLSAKHRLCMTGTPMENHLGELWSLMHFLSPGYLGAEKQFRRIFRDPIEKHGDKLRRSALARRIRPFIMRRRKEEVAVELPEKTEIVRTVELDGQQRDLYETIRLAMQQRVQDEIASKGMNRSHIVILDALLKLRQVCCDPRLVKLDHARQVKESAKLDLLKEMLPEMVSEGRRVLLFSQFTSMLDLIAQAVETLKIPYVRLTGDTVDRETPVRRFQKGEVPLFLISLRAGGTGLNLTAADTVIHYDPWWNPAVERQATDRAHRIGQDKRVFVYKLVTAGTVEDKIVAMQERKKELVAGLLGEGAQENIQLTKEDLDHLFDPLG